MLSQYLNSPVLDTSIIPGSGVEVHNAERTGGGERLGEEVGRGAGKA